MQTLNSNFMWLVLRCVQRECFLLVHHIHHLYSFTLVFKPNSCSGTKYFIIYVCRFNELDEHQSGTPDPRSDVPEDDHPHTHTTSPQITVTHQSHHHVIHPKNTRQSRPNTCPTLNPHQRRNTMKDPKILPGPQWSAALEAKMVSNYQSYGIN